MCWLCWTAKKKPSRLSQKWIEQYESEVHALLADITGLRAKIISLEEAANKQVTQLANEVYALDVQVAKAGLQFDVDCEQCANQLAGLHEQISNMEDKIPAASAKIMDTHVANKSTE
jgi:hypothetical protein